MATTKLVPSVDVTSNTSTPGSVPTKDPSGRVTSPAFALALALALAFARRRGPSVRMNIRKNAKEGAETKEAGRDGSARGGGTGGGGGAPSAESTRFVGNSGVPARWRARSVRARSATSPRVGPADVFAASPPPGTGESTRCSRRLVARGRGSVARRVDREVRTYPSRPLCYPGLCLPVAGGRAPPRLTGAAHSQPPSAAKSDGRRSARATTCEHATRAGHATSDPPSAGKNLPSGGG